MTEIIRYSRLGKEDLNLGSGTFEVRLADGRVVVLTKIDVGALLNDGTISTQALSLGDLTVTGLTVSGALSLSSLTISGAFTLTNGQITFPATQNPSSNANTLDDYEEGTWTPSVGGSATYNSQQGSYIKIGRAVMVYCSLDINAIGTGSTSEISGLPFTAIARSFPLAVGEADDLALSVVSVTAHVNDAATTIALRGRSAASVDDTQVAILGSGTSLKLGGWYMADA